MSRSSTARWSSHDPARPDELAIHFDHTGIAGLDRPKLRVITHLSQLDPPDVIDDIDQARTRPNLAHDAVENDRAHTAPMKREMCQTPGASYPRDRLAAIALFAGGARRRGSGDEEGLAGALASGKTFHPSTTPTAALFRSKGEA